MAPCWAAQCCGGARAAVPCWAARGDAALQRGLGRAVLAGAGGWRGGAAQFCGSGQRRLVGTVWGDAAERLRKSSKKVVALPGEVSYILSRAKRAALQLVGH